MTHRLPPRRWRTALGAFAAASLAALYVAAGAWAAPLVLTRVGSFGTGGGDAGSVAFSPSGRLLASANDTAVGPGTVSVFSVGSTGTLTPVPGSPFAAGRAASSVAFSPDGRLLVTANDQDGTLSVFAIGSGGQLTQVPGSPFSAGPVSSSVAFSPSGGLLAVTVGGAVKVFSVGSDGQLTQVPGSPFAEPRYASWVAFSPSGGLLATANQASGPFLGGEGGSCHQAPCPQPPPYVPGTVSMFSVGSGGQLTQVGSPFVDSGLWTAIYSVAFSPRGSLLAAGNLRSVSVLSVGSNGELTEVPGSPFSTGSIGGGSVAFSGDGGLLASYDGTLSVFSVGANGQLTQVAGSPLPSGNISEPLGAVAFSPSGGLLATADVSANTVSVFSVAPAPVPAVSQLSIRPRAFRAATHGTTIVNGTHTGALISYRDTLAARASFTVYRVHWQPKCATPQRQLCRRLVLAGRFSRLDRAGTNAFRFSGRLRGHALPSGSYVLKLTAELNGGSNSRPLTARFTILPPLPRTRPS